MEDCLHYKDEKNKHCDLCKPSENPTFAPDLISALYF